MPRAPKGTWSPLAVERDAREYPLASVTEHVPTPQQEYMANSVEQLAATRTGHGSKFGIFKDPATGGTHVRSVMVSVATKGVVTPKAFADYPMVPSPGSR